jgi:hypothetical protein
LGWSGYGGRSRVGRGGLGILVVVRRSWVCTGGRVHADGIAFFLDEDADNKISRERKVGA